MPKTAPIKTKQPAASKAPYEPPKYRTDTETSGVLQGLHATCKSGAAFEHGTLWIGGNKENKDARVIRIPCKILSTIPDPPSQYDKQRISLFPDDGVGMRLCEAIDQAIYRIAIDAGGVPEEGEFYGLVNSNGYPPVRVKTSEVGRPLPNCPGGIKAARADEPGLLSIEIMGVYRLRTQDGKAIFGPLYKLVDWEASQEGYERGLGLAANYLE